MREVANGRLVSVRVVGIAPQGTAAERLFRAFRILNLGIRVVAVRAVDLEHRRHTSYHGGRFLVIDGLRGVVN